MKVKAKERGLYRGRLVEPGEVFEVHAGFKGSWAEKLTTEEKAEEKAEAKADAKAGKAAMKKAQAESKPGKGDPS